MSNLKVLFINLEEKSEVLETIKTKLGEDIDYSILKIIPDKFNSIRYFTNSKKFYLTSKYYNCIIDKQNIKIYLKKINLPIPITGFTIKQNDLLIKMKKSNLSVYSIDKINDLINQEFNVEQYNITELPENFIYYLENTNLNVFIKLLDKDLTFGNMSNIILSKMDFTKDIVYLMLLNKLSLKLIKLYTDENYFLESIQLEKLKFNQNEKEKITVKNKQETEIEENKKPVVEKENVEDNQTVTDTEDNQTVTENIITDNQEALLNI